MTADIQSKTDYTSDPKGQYAFYSDEINASEKMLRKWKKQASKIVDLYTGKQEASTTTLSAATGTLNLFHSNVQTIGSMLYGNLPRIDVSRRYADADDDTGRVAAEVMERLLNLDVQQNGAEYDSVLRSTLFDRLVSGLGCARVRYEADIQTVQAPEGMPNQEQLVSEQAPVEYYFWGDVLWSWARNFSEVRWIAFRNYLTKDEVANRFSEHAANNLTYQTQRAAGDDDDDQRDPDMEDAWQRAEVWELWDKNDRTVVWLSLGYDRILDTTPDPLQLEQFFPTPPFFLANPTTSLYIPTPDYTLSQDLYSQIDLLQERITIITEAVKVVGVYDSSAEGIQRMLKEGTENDLIPIDNWALFAEKGGIKGQVDWLPLADIVGALDKLREMRSETIGLLQQVTGMADIMRGGLENQYEGVGQSAMKAKFGSVRVQALQDQFAQFASDLLQLKAEVIARHFSPATIAQQSNMQQSQDRDMVPAAIELIKQPEEARLHIVIRPESVAMQDFAQLKDERTGYLNALSTFMQASAPLMAEDPAAKPFLLQLLQWGLAGFKGSQEIEGVIDRAIEASIAAAEEEKPDPAQQEQQLLQQMEQMKTQMEMQKIQAKSQADLQVREADKRADIETAAAEHQMKIAEITAQTQAKLAETQAKMIADIQLEQIQTQANVSQAQAGAESEIRKDAINTDMEIQKEVAKTSLKLQELAASSKAKIQEAAAKPTTGAKDD